MSEAETSYPPRYSPPATLKSTQASKEAEFDLDRDSLESDDAAIEQLSIPTAETEARLANDEKQPNLREGDEEDGPLLEGLLEQSARRGSLSLEHELPWIGEKKGAGLFSGIANMSNAVLGAGIVGLPFALRQAGFVSGIVLLVILGIVTDWTINLIAINAKLSSTTTYIDGMYACFGQPGRTLCSFFQFAFAFGGMCAFCIVLGDTLPHVLTSLLPASLSDTAFFRFIFSRDFLICFFTLSVSYPLSLYRDIEKLSRASAMALLSMCVILTVVAVHGPGLDAAYKGPTEDKFTLISSGIPSAIGVISFAYVCHHNTLLIYGSLSRPTLDRFAQVTHISISFSVAISLTMAICGYLIFTSVTQGNILNNFPQTDLLANIARLCFGMNMFATLPLECFVCREVLETYFFPGEAFNRNRHFVITTLLVVCSMMVSLVTSDLGAVLEIAGGCGAALLAYVFPAACHLKLSKESINPRRKWAAIACCAFGIAVALLVLLKTITRTLTSKAAGV